MVLARDISYTVRDAKSDLSVLGDCAQICLFFSTIEVLPCPDSVPILDMAVKNCTGLRLLGRDFVRKLESRFVVKFDLAEWQLCLDWDDISLFRPAGWKSLSDGMKPEKLARWLLAE